MFSDLFLGFKRAQRMGRSASICMFKHISQAKPLRFICTDTTPSFEVVKAAGWSFHFYFVYIWGSILLEYLEV